MNVEGTSLPILSWLTMCVPHLKTDRALVGKEHDGTDVASVHLRRCVQRRIDDVGEARRIDDVVRQENKPLKVKRT